MPDHRIKEIYNGIATYSLKLIAVRLDWQRQKVMF